MELTAPPPDGDPLAVPIRARLFGALLELRRPATTRELADLTGRHPNTTRVQLQRLEAAGLIECRRQLQARGRPRHVWAVLPTARPAGRPPEAHANLGRWLARAMARGRPTLDDVEHAGLEIGRELAPSGVVGNVRHAMLDALTALGFAPHAEATAGGTRFVLGNCPYRDAVAENPAVVCRLHRGITQGLLDRLQAGAAVTDFVARDPHAAGCVIEIAPG